MTNSEVIEVLEKEESYMLSHGGDRQAKALRIAIDKIEQDRWIPVKTRKLTDAEEEDMFENSNYYYNYMFDCLLPEDGEKVLVTTSTGEVTDTTFYDEGIDGCYFEFYEDEGDVIAWMPKPKSYKAESEVKDGNDD